MGTTQEVADWSGTGWNLDSQISLAEEFINDEGLDDLYREFLEKKARQKNSEG